MPDQKEEILEADDILFALAVSALTAPSEFKAEVLWDALTAAGRSDVRDMASAYVESEAMGEDEEGEDPEPSDES
jgi:hypothetical protein